jgi:predicted RNA-binding protein with PIN domain
MAVGATEHPQGLASKSAAGESNAAGAAATPALPPARLWLVDGFNVLHSVLLGGESRERWWTASERSRLRVRAERFDVAGAEIWLVFDGSRPAPDPVDAPDGGATRVSSVFAASADLWLARRVRAAEHAGEIAVVTADRSLAGRCRHAGAHIVTPRDFLAHCPRD